MEQEDHFLFITYRSTYDEMFDEESNSYKDVRILNITGVSIKHIKQENEPKERMWINFNPYEHDKNDIFLLIVRYDQLSNNIYRHTNNEFKFIGIYDTLEKANQVKESIENNSKIAKLGPKTVFKRCEIVTTKVRI